MTTTINVTCTQCGTANSVPAGAMLATVATEGLDFCLAGSVWFICCGCVDIVTEPVAWQPFLTLLTAGVPLVEDDMTDDHVDDSDAWGTPGAVSSVAMRTPHPEHPLDGPAFTPDDELDMHELLSGDTWFPELVTTGAPPGGSDSQLRSQPPLARTKPKGQRSRPGTATRTPPPKRTT